MYQILCAETNTVLQRDVYMLSTGKKNDSIDLKKTLDNLPRTDTMLPTYWYNIFWLLFFLRMHISIEKKGNLTIVKPRKSDN